MKLNFWTLMIVKDDYILSLLGKIFALKSAFSFRIKRVLKGMKKYQDIYTGKTVYVILNGPSLKEQDISALAGGDIMFVNRGFKHPLYAKLKPKFHVFVDPKMLSGEWDVKWIDEIIQMVPDISFVLPVEWYFHEKFQDYIKRKISIIWIRSTDKFKCLGVSGECFSSAIFLGYKTIYFTGFDGNGIGYELINHAGSHFYGTNEENLTKTSENYVVDLYMHSRHLRDLRNFAKSCSKKGILIYNLTHGGLIDMFPRRKITEIFNQSNY